ncbi:hypothetical protein JCM8547_007823 [Rhodosporidiobolus lusitaniae]
MLNSWDRRSDPDEDLFPSEGSPSHLAYHDPTRDAFFLKPSSASPGSHAPRYSDRAVRAAQKEEREKIARETHERYRRGEMGQEEEDAYLRARSDAVHGMRKTNVGEHFGNLARHVHHTVFKPLGRRMFAYHRPKVLKAEKEHRPSMASTLVGSIHSQPFEKKGYPY